MMTTETDSQVGESACGPCGAKYRPKRAWQRFCSPSCRFANWDKCNPRHRQVTQQLHRIEAKLDSVIEPTVSHPYLPKIRTDCLSICPNESMSKHFGGRKPPILHDARSQLLEFDSITRSPR